MTLETLNYLVALGSLVMGLGAVLLLALFAFGRTTALAGMIRGWAVPLSLVIVLAGVVMSLVYSEYFGIAPCSLCWYQRMFLYPQGVLLVLALWWHDTRVALYSIAFSLLGGAIALYQHFLQMTGEGVLPCPASAGDCIKRFLFEFDFVTFPLVSFFTFALLIALMLFTLPRHE